MDSIKEGLDRIEADIAEVKRQYDQFFQGNRKTEPAEERRTVEGLVRKMGQRRIVNTQDQFRFNSLQSRFYSLVNLWTRMMRELEEGRLTRDAGGSVARPAAAENGPVDPAHLEQVLGVLREARVACGLPVEEEDLSAIRQTLSDRARELSEQSGRKVEFKVSVEGGKPKVKAVMRPSG